MEEKSGSESIMDCIFPDGLQAIVVDDYEPSLTVFASMLLECKFKVTPCNHPSVALDILRERGSAFKLIVIHAHMSNMDAFAFLKKSRKLHHIPALMITLIQSEKVAKKCLDYSDCYHLVYPFQVAKLMDLSYSAISTWQAYTISNLSKGSRQQVGQASAQPSRPPLDHGIVRGTETEEDIMEHRMAQYLDLTPEAKKPIAEALDKLETHLAVAKKVLELMGRGECRKTRDRKPPAVLHQEKNN